MIVLVLFLILCSLITLYVKRIRLAFDTWEKSSGGLIVGREEIIERQEILRLFNWTEEFKITIRDKDGSFRSGMAKVTGFLHPRLIVVWSDFPKN